LALEGNVVQAHAGGGCSLPPGCVSRDGELHCARSSAWIKCPDT
jgi:hypothetical protein